MKFSTSFPVTFFVVMSFVCVSCSQNDLTGTVQNSQLTADGYELPLGTGGKADYVLVETKALVDLQGVIAIQKDRRNAIYTFGNQYVGKKIKVTGIVEKDASGRKFIKVSEKSQIELL